MNKKYYPNLAGIVMIAFFTAFFLGFAVFFILINNGGSVPIYFTAAFTALAPVIILFSTIPKYKIIELKDSGIKVNRTFYLWKDVDVEKINDEVIEHKALHFFTVAVTENQIITLRLTDSSTGKVRRFLLHNKVFSKYNEMKEIIFTQVQLGQ